MDSSLSAEAESLRVLDPLASNPECVKVKDWRHKLQKAFLGESMPAESASCGFVEEKKWIFSDSQCRKCRTGTKYSSLSSLTTL